MKQEKNEKKSVKEKEEKSKIEEAVLLKEAVLPSGINLSEPKDVEVALHQEIKVIFEPESFVQLFAYAYSTECEICCLGEVERDGLIFRIKKLHLIEQDASGCSVKLDEDSLGKFMEEMLAKGNADAVKNLKCWCHSHPRMGVFWSKTDLENIERLLSDYLVSVVVSENYSMLCRVDMRNPVAISFDNVPAEYGIGLDKATIEKYRQEIKDKLMRKSLFIEKDVPGQRTFWPCTSQEECFQNYCDLCGKFHSDEGCPAEKDNFHDAWEEYVKDCKEKGIVPDEDDFYMAMYGEGYGIF